MCKGIKLILQIVCTLVLFINPGILFAQQDPIFTQYLNNIQIVNPAYAGVQNTINITAINRMQWIGIDGAPVTQTVSASIPVSRHQVGLGVSLIHDKIGPLNQTGLYLDYSYKLRFFRTRLALGIKSGVNYYTYNLSTLSSMDPDDYLFGKEKTSIFLPNFGLGAYYFSSLFYIGLSVPKLLRNDLNESQSSTTRQSREERHYFVMGGIVFPFSEDVMLKPSFIAKIVQGAPSSVEVNGTFIFFGKLWLGAFYRFGDSYGALAQLKVSKSLKFGYSFDTTSTRLRNYHHGTHEVLLSYDIYWGEGDVLSPRFF